MSNILCLTPIYVYFVLVLVQNHKQARVNDPACHCEICKLKKA